MLRVLLSIAAALLATAAPALAADENLAPTTKITGSATQLAWPHGIAVDAAGSIYTANQSDPNEGITVHAYNANGNAAPSRQFYATSGGGTTPLGLCIDANDHVWVAYNNGIVNEFAANASGAVAPLRTINTGPAGTGGTRGIAIDSHGQIYVSSHDAAKIVVYAADATGNATPIHVIAGLATKLSGGMGIAITPTDDLIATRIDPGSGQPGVLRFTYGADGNTAPVGSIIWGGFSSSEGPNGVALDQSGNIYVTDRTASKVSVWPASALTSASDSDTPSRVIVGASTGLAYPIGIAVQTSTGTFAVANIDDLDMSITVFGSLTGTSSGGSQSTPSQSTTSPTSTTSTTTRTPPKGPVGISIDAGADYTNSTAVKLRVVWPAGASTMLISNDGGFRNATSVAVAKNVDWKIRSSGPDRLPKTVYVRFVGDGIDETKTFTDDIILDETAPVILSARVTYIGGARMLVRRPKGTYRVDLRAKDNLAGIDSVRLKLGSKTIVSRDYRARLLVTDQPIAVQVCDGAGNWSDWRQLK